MLEQAFPEGTVTIDTIPLGVVVLNKAGHVVALNQVMQQWFGDKSDAILGLDADSADEELKYLFNPDEIQIVEDRWWYCQKRELDGGDGYTAHYYQDITSTIRLQEEKEHLEKRVDELVTTDPISGLMNRRSLFQCLDSHVSRSRRYHNQLTLVMMSVDAGYNIDTIHPPKIGDDGIRTISNMLKDQMRWADQIAHLDEQRFMLILPETDAAAAVALTEKLHSSLSGLEIVDKQGSPMQVGVRFGIAEWEQGDDTRRLFKRVTERLDGSVAMAV